MKYALIALSFAAGQVIACPADGTKDAAAPSSGKSAVVAKAKPAASPALASKASIKVAAKPATEPRKAASL